MPRLNYKPGHSQNFYFSRGEGPGHDAAFHDFDEVIADFNSATSPKVKADEAAIFEMLQRRPCTAKQIADVFGMHLNEVAKFTGMLLKAGKIASIDRGGDIYYLVEGPKN